MTWLLHYVDPLDLSFMAAVLTIASNPFLWNVAARWEHRICKLSSALRSPHLACYSPGGIIQLLSVLHSRWHTSPTGLLLTVVVVLVYVVASL
ncbi:phosphatidylethanolamine N-methyltransferase-like isoform X2 [Octodon degus]|uniref:Phosphatidylethanolamine N-methyltransferase-like isoform X2 n=1 Tax=Octodon degus TaxID=10160 RepID=A0A6P6EI33_OCTDE|nr:phosphatidylethanolamine N-methyltransferase-like isoform X2 [Octodon degus]